MGFIIPSFPVFSSESTGFTIWPPSVTNGEPVSISISFIVYERNVDKLSLLWEESISYARI